MADSFSGLSSPTLSWISAVYDVNGAADKATFVAPFKCEVVRIFTTVLDGITGAGGATITFDDVVSSTRTDGGIGTLTIPAANNDSKYIYEEPATRKTLNPGDQVVVEVTVEGVGASHNVVSGLLYREVPEVLGNIANAVAG